jgi:hypothetical protein
LANRIGLWSAGVAAGVILSMGAVAPAPAVVPPKNCGTMHVKGKTYNIKVDQIRCSKGRKYSRRYLKSHNRPSGYSCQDYGSETKVKFRCWDGIKEFFAIRH